MSYFEILQSVLSMRRLTLLSNVNIAAASLSTSQNWRATWRKATRWRVYSSEANFKTRSSFLCPDLCCVCECQTGHCHSENYCLISPGGRFSVSSDYKHSALVRYTQLISGQRPNKNAKSIDQTLSDIKLNMFFCCCILVTPCSTFGSLCLVPVLYVLRYVLDSGNLCAASFVTRWKC